MMKEKFTRWDVLFAQYLKRDWKKIIVWVIGLGLFCSGFVPAFKEIAKGEGLYGMYETMRNPAMIAMVGPTPVTEVANYTVGAMYAQMMLVFCGLFAMIISVLHVVGHTRKEEELGLTELVRSYRVGRQANSLGVIVETLLINLALGLFTGAVIASFSVKTISVEGAFLFGLSVTVAGVIAGVIALVIAQIMPTSSGATGASLGIVGLLYLVRAGTDVSNSDLTIFNPLGWTYLTFPFTTNNWLPLLYAVIFCGVLLGISFVLEEKRDMGAGYLPEKEGRGTAKKSLLSVQGLLLTLNKGVIISWLLTFAVMGAAYGSIYGDMQTFLEANDLLKEMFSHAGSSIEASFTGTIMVVMIALVAVLPVLLVNKLFTEEHQLRLSQLFSTKVTRSQLYWTTIGLAILSAVVGILASTLGLGGTALGVMGTKSSLALADFIKVGFNLFPAVLFFIGLAALMLGWAPKLGKIVYGYIGYSFALNYFAGILNLPDWLEKTAIMSWLPKMPTEPFDGTVFTVLIGIGCAMIISGFVGYRQRDLIEGS